MIAIKNKSIFLFVAFVTFAFAFHLLYLINTYSVNVFYWDQWDFLDGFFNNKSLLELFRWQHGPHRQGLGALFLKVVYGLSSWSGRAEVMTSAVVMIISCLIMMRIKVKLIGPLVLSDIFFPILYFTISQSEIFFGTSNPSHGPLPNLLVALTCSSLFIENRKVRWSTLGILSFFSFYTGFAIFNGMIAPQFILRDAIVSKEDRKLGIFIFCLTILSCLTFFIGYHHAPAIECFKFPHDHVGEYFEYSGRMVGGLLGIKCGTRMVLEKALLLYTPYVALILTAIYSAFNLIRPSTEKERKFFEVVLLCSSFTLVFTFFDAIGRVCAGMEGALAARYVPYIFPGLIGIYLVIQKFPTRYRQALVGLLLLGLIFKEVSRYRFTMDQIKDLRAKKLEWAQCILDTDNPDLCHERMSFKIFPVPGATHLKEKVSFLKENKLSFYAE